MRLPPSERPRTAQALGAGFLSGLRYVWGAPALRNLLLLLGVVSGLGVQYNLLMPVFARTVLGTNAFGFGLLHTAGGVGAIAAALQLAARRYSRAQHRRHLLLGLVTFAGYGMVRYLATTNTLLQLVVEDRYRGRMMGLHTVMFLGTQPLGSLVLGALAQRFGAPGAALVSGGVSLAAAGWLALRLRRVALRERAAAGAPGASRPRVSTD